MIKAVIFDVGGVLIRTADRRSRRVWEDRLGLAERESERIVFDSLMGMKAQTGEITNEALWTWVGQHLSLTRDQLVAFRDDFWAGDRLDVQLASYIRSIQAEYQTAIISNATDNLRHILKEKYPIDDAFELIVCSAEEKVMKPDQEIYLRTLTRLGREAPEAVFVDDNESNVVSARKLGMKGLLFTATTDVPKSLAEFGVTAGG